MKPSFATAASRRDASPLTPFFSSVRDKDYTCRGCGLTIWQWDDCIQIGPKRRYHSECYTKAFPKGPQSAAPKKPRGKPFAKGDDPRRAASPAASSDDASQLAALIAKLAGQQIDEAKVREIARSVFEAEPGHKITLHLDSVQAPKVGKVPEVRHAAFEAVLNRLQVGLKNILLVGPSGSGKSTLAKQVAESIDAKFASVSASAGMSEGVLLGRLLPTGEAARFEYAQSPFVTLYEEGGVFLLDEIDAADPNVLIVLNTAVANGHLDVPNRLDKPVATRHPDFVLLAGANTWGNGADRQYVGRNQLDAATLSRFAGATIEMQYDETMEQALRVALADALDVADKAPAFVNQFYFIRERIASNRIRRVWGTRELLAGIRNLKVYSVDEALQTLAVGWSDDEKRNAGVPS